MPGAATAVSTGEAPILESFSSISGGDNKRVAVTELSQAKNRMNF
jgi:hypothetical protein